MSPPSMTTVAVLITCFNRRAKTLACLAQLRRCQLPPAHRLQVILVDDASTDGTPEAVAEEFPEVQLVRSEGGLFWCRGMHFAMQIAQRDAPAYYAWLNDDVVLSDDAFMRLLTVTDQHQRDSGRAALVVGATRSPDTGKPSYGGYVSLGGLRHLTYRLVFSADQVLACDTINGNFVLIPAPIVQRIGLIDAEFAHAMGDTDYALRARRAGFAVLAAPGYIGECRNNPAKGTWSDASLPLSRRMRLMLDRKGLPMASWWRFTRRHGGLLWPLHFAWPYLRLMLSGAGTALRGAPLKAGRG